MRLGPMSPKTLHSGRLSIKDLFSELDFKNVYAHVDRDYTMNRQRPNIRTEFRRCGLSMALQLLSVFRGGYCHWSIGNVQNSLEDSSWNLNTLLSWCLVEFLMNHVCSTLIRPNLIFDMRSKYLFPDATMWSQYLFPNVTMRSQYSFSDVTISQHSFSDVTMRSQYMYSFSGVTMLSMYSIPGVTMRSFSEVSPKYLWHHSIYSLV